MHIIGITGMSCSGKSTIAELLTKKLNAELISLDQLYIQGSPKVYVKHNGQKLRSFERPELYDGKALAEALSKLKQQMNATLTIRDGLEEGNKIYINKAFTPNKNYVIEGFLLLCYPELRDIIDEAYYIDIPTEVSIQRRIKRGRENVEKIEHYTKFGVQEWENNGAQQKKYATILDGTIASERNVEKIIEKMKKKEEN